jgi:hypothetical protein
MPAIVSDSGGGLCLVRCAFSTMDSAVLELFSIIGLLYGARFPPGILLC